MKLLDAIRSVDRSPENTFGADPDEFIAALGLSLYVGWSKTFDDRVKAHWLHRWMCTDTSVGHCAYYLDGEPVAYSYQEGRKCDLNLSFVSVEAADKMRNLILGLPELDQPGFRVVGENDQIDEFQTIEFTNQVMDTFAYCQGVPVMVVDYSSRSYTDQTVAIVSLDSPAEPWTRRRGIELAAVALDSPAAPPLRVGLNNLLFPIKVAANVQLEGLL